MKLIKIHTLNTNINIKNILSSNYLNEKNKNCIRITCQKSYTYYFFISD